MSDAKSDRGCRLTDLACHPFARVRQRRVPARRRQAGEPPAREGVQTASREPAAGGKLPTDDPAWIDHRLKPVTCGILNSVAPGQYQMPPETSTYGCCTNGAKTLAPGGRSGGASARYIVGYL